MRIPQAVGKLLFETRLRKKEYVVECAKFDSRFQSSVEPAEFDIILSRFSEYLSKRDRTELVSFFTEGRRVNYLEVLNMRQKEQVRYVHPFLKHLNKEDKSIRKGKKLDLKPLEELEMDLLEDNFIIEHAQKLFEYFSLHSRQMSTDLFFDSVFADFDLDKDEMFTIGDFHLFLLYCNQELELFEERFLFECFDSVRGRISKSDLKYLVFEMGTKKLNKIERKEFDLEEIIKVEQRAFFKLNQEARRSKMCNMVADSVKTLGKTFLTGFFRTDLVSKNNKKWILMEKLAIGYHNLGYDTADSVELGRFKVICVKQGAILFQKDKLYVDLETLFSFVENIFDLKRIENPIKTEEELVYLVGRELTALFDSFLRNKLFNGANQIDENRFRRNFIETFGLVDHKAMDYFCKMELKEGVLKEKEVKVGRLALENIRFEEFKHIYTNIFGIELLRNTKNSSLVLPSSLDRRRISYFIQDSLFNGVTEFSRESQISEINNRIVVPEMEETETENRRTIELVEVPRETNSGVSTNLVKNKQVDKAYRPRLDSSKVMECLKKLSDELKEYLEKQGISSTSVNKVSILSKLTALFKGKEEINLGEFEKTVESAFSTESALFLNYYANCLSNEDNLAMQSFLAKLEEVLISYLNYNIWLIKGE